MRSGRKGREERSVLQTAVFGAQCSVYHVILKLILWLLQFLTQWEFWQSEATKWPPHEALMTYWDDWHRRECGRKKKKKETRTKSPLHFHRRRSCVIAVAPCEFLSQRCAWQVPRGEQGPPHARTESKSGGKWILTRLQETQTETNVLNPPRHHRLKIASWPW